MKTNIPLFVTRMKYAKNALYKEANWRMLKKALHISILVEMAISRI